jgi:hypothetical protein
MTIKMLQLSKLIDGFYRLPADGVFNKRLIDAGFIEICSLILRTIHKGWHDADTITGAVVRKLEIANY